jgi:predicted patatin/cPLA2 family phospholipase
VTIFSPRSGRFACLSALFLSLLVAGLACQIKSKGKRPTPLPEGVEPNDVIDTGGVGEPSDPLGPLESSEITKVFLTRRAEAALERRAREEKIGKTPDGKPYRQKEYNILVLSGGGVYGAYPAGILCGWTACEKSPAEGGRPSFDVVTGVSTGALIAPMAFLGPAYDPYLKQLYTTVTNDDIFKIRRSVRSFFAESLADSAPLRQRIDCFYTMEAMRKIAAEHEKGRRLYIGTTNLDTKRLVVWDIGAIASKGTEAARKLIVDVTVASAAIPGFFPSVRFNVNIDGQPYEELHVDGSVARAMFFRPPVISANEQEIVGPNSLAGSNLFALVAGKAYPDPEGVRARTIAVVGAAISNLLYVTARGDLYRFYTYSTISGMDFFTAAIPPDLKVTNNSTNFDSAETTKMFNEAYRVGALGAFNRTTKADPKSAEKPPKPFAYPDGSPILFKEPGPGWRNTPPGLETGERGRNRAGLNLTIKKDSKEPNRPQGTDQAPDGAPPVKK